MAAEIKNIASIGSSVGAKVRFFLINGTPVISRFDAFRSFVLTPSLFRKRHKS
jgi:hypothetical protein